MRMWFKQYQDTRLIKDLTLEDASEETRTHKIFGMLEEACYQFDLSKPIWLELNIKEFQNYSRTRFTQDSFIEELAFDYLEIEVLEED